MKTCAVVCMLCGAGGNGICCITLLGHNLCVHSQLCACRYGGHGISKGELDFLQVLKVSLALMHCRMITTLAKLVARVCIGVSGV